MANRMPISLLFIAILIIMAITILFSFGLKLHSSIVKIIHKNS
jgi:hypothetical protein